MRALTALATLLGLGMLGSSAVVGAFGRDTNIALLSTAVALLVGGAIVGSVVRRGDPRWSRAMDGVGSADAEFKRLGMRMSSPATARSNREMP